MSEGCDLAIENRMITHSPEVVEMLQSFDIPVMIEYSSYEQHPLGKVEWVKFFGALTGKEAKAEEAFAEQTEILEEVESGEKTGKTIAFFYVTSNGLIQVRQSTDYIPKLIELAGGRYIFENLEDSGSGRSTLNMQVEDFYAGAKDADILIYNSSIDGGVTTVDELIAAIGPNVDIVLDAELYDLSTATGYGTSKGDYYYWLDEFDGPQLVIEGVDNLTIRSNDGSVTGHTIAAIPRYANVLTFQSCSYITLSGFTAGHTREPGYCIGGVLRFQDSDHITVDKCGLYGCGILGVDAEYCTDIRVANCDIYECSQGGVQFWSSEGIVMENNTLRDLGGSDMSFHDCKDVTVNGETVIPASMFLSLILQSEEQQGTEALNAFVTEFAYAYFYGDMDTLPRLLSKDYTGGVEAYSGNTNDVIVCWHEVTVDMWKEAEANGTYEFAYPYRENVDSEIAYLTIVVVRENDAWKVSSYSLAE